MGSGGAQGHIRGVKPKGKRAQPVQRENIMSHLPADLHQLFPLDAELMRDLKTRDRHFATLADRYAALDDEIRRSETGVAPALDDAHAEGLKRERLVLLDQIAAVLEGERA
jgi:uncharacterized protein YdcH (DUF465 family)